MTTTVRKKIAKWTLPIFLERAIEIHSDKFDYSLVKPEDVQGAKSYITLKCNVCTNNWTTSIGNIINNKANCINCVGGRQRWTLERFLLKGREIHGNRFDYSQITSDHIRGQKTNVPIKCRTCQYSWSPPISSHIDKKRGCPSCAGNAPWTL